MYLRARIVDVREDAEPEADGMYFVAHIYALSSTMMVTCEKRRVHGLARPRGPAAATPSDPLSGVQGPADGAATGARAVALAAAS